MYIKTIGFVLGSLLLVSCANMPTKSCNAIVSHSPTEYDICTPKGAEPGDRIALFKERCTTRSRGSVQQCRNEKVGEGSILKSLDEHLSTIKLDSPFEITESMTVEAKKNSSK